MKRMRAVGVCEPGGPEALGMIELPVPTPSAGEIAVRVRAATVNPVDTAVRRYGLAQHGIAPPWIPGMELCGTVDAAGAGTDWERGTRVMAIVSPFRAEGGAQAEVVVIPADAAARVPDTLSDAEAATVPMNGLTARAALRALDLPPGAILGVTGAAGALGGYVVELGRAAGLTVVADATPEDEALVRNLGAHVVVPASKDADAEVGAFRQAVSDGVDGLVDAAVLDAAALAIVADGGKLVTVRMWDGPTERGIRIHPVSASNLLHEGPELAGLADLAGSGGLTVRVAQTYPVESVADAHRRLEAGGTRGRLVLVL